MQILLLGRSSSVTKTLQTMLKAIDGWNVHVHSNIKNLTPEQGSGAEHTLLLANLEDFNASATKIISQIRNYLPHIPLLVIHSYTNKSLIKPMIKAGATGYVNSDISENILVEAVRQVANSNKYIIADST